jgi:hypothetical protein
MADFKLRMSSPKAGVVCVVVMALLVGCAVPQPTALPPTVAPSATPLATWTPAPTVAPVAPAATWTPVVTLGPQAYLEAMREAASAMRLAARTLEHTDLVLTRHLTDTVPSREVLSLAASDGRILRAMRDAVRQYQGRGLLTPALAEALTALDSADATFRIITDGSENPLEMLLAIQDAEAQLLIARQALREELVAHGVPEAQADELAR